jgi:hypothetical protein
MAKVVRPDGLGVKASVLWDEITGEFELRADERRSLEDACRTVDLIERLEAEIRDGPSFVAGSNGQDVANPLMTEIRLHRAQFSRSMQAVHLPAEEDTPAARSAHGRALVAHRWKRTA